MGQEMVIPDWAKSGPAQAFNTLNPATDNLADGIGQSYPIIGYRGKVWSVRSRGQKHNIVRPDDGTPVSFIDVIILDQNPAKSKSYYLDFDPEAAGARPLCASIDGVVPDSDVAQRQADVCALCPRNEWKLLPRTGKKGKECSDYKRLAVLLLPAQTQNLPGGPVLEPCFLRVPAASLNSLATMGEQMGNMGFHYSTYVTRITFDPNEAHPKMIFKAIAKVPEEHGASVMQTRNEPVVGRIVIGEVALNQPSISGPAPARQPSSFSSATTAAQPATPTGVQPVQHTPPPPQSAQPVFSGLGAIRPQDIGLGAAQPVIEVTPSTVHEGNVTSSPAPSAAAPVPPTGDAGMAEASDDDLDARIAAVVVANKR